MSTKVKKLLLRSRNSSTSTPLEHAPEQKTAPPEPKKSLEPFPTDFEIIYLTSESAVDAALISILDGVVGFDTEYRPRIHTREERIIDDLINKIGGSRKSAILAWQVIEMKTNRRFPYAWSNIGLCTVQIARDNQVWVINIRAMKGKQVQLGSHLLIISPAFPAELRRILTSKDILKVGVGLLSDIPVVWNDLRSELQGLVDAGMMAKLLLAEKFEDTPYGNLSMEVCGAEILNYDIDKGPRTSDWTQELDDMQVQLDAAIDAMASLQLYENLLPALARKADELRQPIPRDWYSFNSQMGEPTRIQLTTRKIEVPWSVKKPARMASADDRTTTHLPFTDPRLSRRSWPVGNVVTTAEGLSFTNELKARTYKTSIEMWGTLNEYPNLRPLISCKRIKSHGERRAVVVTRMRRQPDPRQQAPALGHGKDSLSDEGSRKGAGADTTCTSHNGDDETMRTTKRQN
ncbi:ribonuclease H-like domain-containing protein [Mycena rebaudengoi]|nr:ribonuclease H-like domain-containing protein [Mycena rebaudengoi]